MLDLFQNFNRAIIDEIYTISSNDAIAMANQIATKEGLLCGISAGANVHAALDVARRPENAGKGGYHPCDSGERYLSMKLFNGGKNEVTN